MSNLIISVIAIALVALSVLMAVYYAGSAYLDHESIAGAGSFLNQAQQIGNAFQAYYIANASAFPGSWSDLTGTANGGPYLQSVPMAQVASNGVTPAPIFIAAVATAGGLHYYAYASLGRPLTPGVFDAGAIEAAYCNRLITFATGTPAAGTMTAQPLGSISSAPYGNGTFGCAPTSGTFPANAWGTAPATTDYIAEYKIY